MKVNLAQAYKWNGDQKECDEILQSIDWSAKADHLRLAYLVLADKYADAGDLMRRVGSDNPMLSKQSYRDWPLFREFRRQPQFLEAYQEVFGEGFAVEEESGTGEQDARAEPEDDPDRPTEG